MSFQPTTNPYAPQPAAAPAEVQAQAQLPAQPYFAQPAKPRHALFGWAVAGFIVVGIFGLLLLGYLFLALGPVLLVAGGVLALLPLTAVAFGILWIDRWEPEPRGLLVFALLWGAIMAVAVSLLVDIAVQFTDYVIGTSLEARSVLGPVVQAPIVEELAKGVGVLLIFLIARKYFDGPVDGIVYAATIAGGFAFTENILYFASSMAAGGSIIGAEVVFTFFLRGVLSPFAHVMFTAMIGLFIGWWGRKSVARGVAGFFVGLVPAMALHAFWNGTSFLGLGGWFMLYAIVQVPLFAASIVLVVQLRKREALLTQERLSEYAAAGWLSPQEVGTLATGAGRKQAMTWAKATGHSILMRSYIRDATRLAFARQRIISNRDRTAAQQDERELLAKLTASRQALQAATRQPA